MADDTTTPRARLGAINVRVLPIIAFFARNPDEWLYTEDLCLRLGVDASAVHLMLQRPVAHGLLEREGGSKGRGQQHVWRAGPALLRMLTSQDIEVSACMPTL